MVLVRLHGDSRVMMRVTLTKQARGFRQFLLRGVEKVRAEWAMICTAHNLLKLFTLAKVA
jgi:hypothetical protein